MDQIICKRERECVCVWMSVKEKWKTKKEQTVFIFKLLDTYILLLSLTCFSQKQTKEKWNQLADGWT